MHHELDHATDHVDGRAASPEAACVRWAIGSFDLLRKPDTKEQRLVPLTHGEPVRFGPEGSYAAVREGFGLGVAKADEVDEADIVVHDQADQNLAFALSRLSDQDLNHTVTGIFRNVDRTPYDDAARAQVTHEIETRPADLQALINGQDTWTIAGRPAETRTS